MCRRPGRRRASAVLWLSRELIGTRSVVILPRQAYKERIYRYFLPAQHRSAAANQIEPRLQRIKPGTAVGTGILFRQWLQAVLPGIGIQDPGKIGVLHRRQSVYLHRAVLEIPRKGEASLGPDGRCIEEPEGKSLHRRPILIKLYRQAAFALRIDSLRSHCLGQQAGKQEQTQNQRKTTLTLHSVLPFRCLQQDHRQASVCRRLSLMPALHVFWSPTGLPHRRPVRRPRRRSTLYPRRRWRATPRRTGC